MKEVETSAESGVAGGGKEQVDAGAKVAEEMDAAGPEKDAREKQQDA